MTHFPRQKSRRTVSVLALVIASFVFLMAQDSPSGLRIISSSTTISLTQYGITWTFSDHVEYGQYVNGDYWVVGPVEIVDLDPAASSADGTYKNGSMVNPVSNGSNRQAYDSRQSTYAPHLNVAMGVTEEQPLLLEPGESLVSTISKDGDSHTVLQSAAVLTIVENAPPNDSFRPPYSGGDKPQYQESDLQLSNLLSLSGPSSTPSFSEVASYFERPWLDHVPYASGSQFHPSLNMPWYGRDMASRVSVGALMLLLDAPYETKRSLLIGYVQLGIDLYGIVDSAISSPWTPDGGHSSGRKWPILFAGILLDVDEMRTVGPGDGTGRTYFGEDAQTFYVTQTEVDITNSSSWNPDPRSPTQPYSAAHIGMAEWGIRHATQPAQDNASWQAIYRRCCTATAWSGFVLAARLMNAREMWDHDELFDYQDRYMNITKTATEPDGYPVDDLEAGWRAWTDFAEDMWDTYR